MTQHEAITITPEEFELTVFAYLQEIGSQLDNFCIEHNVKEISNDGTYQIDIRAKFEALGTNIKVLVECKHHKNPIKRETIQILKDKLHSIGAQKGILFTTASFQSGCIEYAEKHGIALVKMIDGKSTYQVKSMEKENIHYPPDLPKYVGQYIYNKTETGYSIYNLQNGWTGGLKDFLLK